jgi:hypothetical protein
MCAHYRTPLSESAGALTLRLTRASAEDGAPRALTACSVCLRVRHGSGWVDAEAVIRTLRSFDFATAPRLNAALCDRCLRSLRERRARTAEPVAERRAA